MTLCSLLALLRLVGSHSDLLALTVLENLCGNLCALYEGSADLYAVVGADCDYVEGYSVICFSVKLLDEDNPSSLVTLYCLPPVWITAYILSILYIGLATAG